MTLSGRMFYFLASSLATKQGRIYVYGERKLELELDLEVLCDKRYRRTCEFVLLLREEPIDSRDMIEQLFLFTLVSLYCQYMTCAKWEEMILLPAYDFSTSVLILTGEFSTSVLILASCSVHLLCPLL